MLRRGLATIFDALTVRELWLQGELYLAARREGLPYLYVNHRPEGYAGAADLSYWSGHEKDAEPLMLAEIKLLGTSGYCTKNFSGNPLGEYLRERKRTPTCYEVVYPRY
jgi:hypothetical protein